MTAEKDLELGAYIVCHMVDYRLRIDQSKLLLCREDLGMARMSIDAFAAAPGPKKRKKLIEAVDGKLQEIAKIVRPMMLRHPTRGVLRTLYDQRTTFANGVSKVPEFLTVFHNAEAQCGGEAHAVWHRCSDLSGVLVDMLQGETAFAEAVPLWSRSLQDEFDGLLKQASSMERRLYDSYSGTEYYDPAVALMRSRIEAVLNGTEATGAKVAVLRRLFDGQSRAHPQVGVLVQMLRICCDQPVVDKLLLESPIVDEILRRGKAATTDQS